MKNKTSNIYTEWLPLIEALPDNQAGEIFKNILKYQNDDDVSCDNPIWIFIRNKLDEYNDSDKNRSKTNSNNAKIRWEKKNATACDGMQTDATACDGIIKEKKIKENKIKDNEKKIKERGTFSKPSLEDIKNYCNSKASIVDPDSFFNFYQSNGWKVGKNPMKDWHACIATWEKRDRDKGGWQNKPTLSDSERRKDRILKELNINNEGEELC